MIEFVGARPVRLCGADALVNPVNCVGVMGKGLALEFKLRYPAMLHLLPYGVPGAGVKARGSAGVEVVHGLGRQPRHQGRLACAFELCVGGRLPGRTARFILPSIRRPCRPSSAATVGLIGRELNHD